MKNNPIRKLVSFFSGTDTQKAPEPPTGKNPYLQREKNKGISIFGYTDIGNRAENEDSMAYDTGENFVFASVCDGLGGHGGGKTASSIAVKWLSHCRDIAELPEAEEITGWLTQANEEIFKVRESRNRMKTTVTFVCVRDHQAIWAHIGDSRIYHFYNGQLVHYTNDHSVPQMNVMMGKISREQIPQSPDRNKVLWVLGDDEELRTEIHDPVTLTPGCHAFLLCSDGFWEYLKDAEIQAELTRSKTPEEWLNSLRSRREQRLTGETDNNTAIAFFVDY